MYVNAYACIPFTSSISDQYSIHFMIQNIIVIFGFVNIFVWLCNEKRLKISNGEIRIHKSKKDRQNNGQVEQNKKTKNEKPTEK